MSKQITEPHRMIRPHKGGRTVRKSALVTPFDNGLLADLKQNTGLSLNDVISWALTAPQLARLVEENKDRP